MSTNSYLNFPKAVLTDKGAEAVCVMLRDPSIHTEICYYDAVVDGEIVGLTPFKRREAVGTTAVFTLDVPLKSYVSYIRLWMAVLPHNKKKKISRKYDLGTPFVGAVADWRTCHAVRKTSKAEIEVCILF